jgi:hypothetical protein
MGPAQIYYMMVIVMSVDASGISKDLLYVNVEEVRDHRYTNSPFRSVMEILSIRTRGSRYEKIVIEALQDLGKTVLGRTNPSNDCVFDGLKTEIKGAKLCKDKDHYIFNQIRPDGDWDQALLACFDPHKIFMYLLSKKQVEHLIGCGVMKTDKKSTSKGGVIKGQHGGQHSVNVNTYILGATKSELVSYGAIEII